MSVDQLGFVQTTDGRTALIVPANNEAERERARRELSRDVLFTKATDMRSLEELLDAHEVLYAVLEAPAPTVQLSLNVGASEDWRAAAWTATRETLASAARGEPVNEDLAYLAALAEASVDDALRRIEEFLDTPSSTLEGWDAFLEQESRRVGEEVHPLGRYEADGIDEWEPGDGDARTPLLTPADLSVTFTGGAFGGPRPLAE